MAKNKDSEKTITYGHFGDYVAVWCGEKQIHFHDSNLSIVLDKLGDVLGFTTERIDLDSLFDDETQDNLLDGVTLTEVKELLAERKATELQDELEDLREKVRQKEIELGRLGVGNLGFSGV